MIALHCNNFKEILKGPIVLQSDIIKVVFLKHEKLNSNRKVLKLRYAIKSILENVAYDCNKSE